MNGSISYGVVTPESVAAMSGREFLEAMRDGLVPQPPMAEPLQFRLIEIDEGRVVFEGQPQRAFYNPFGAVHGGWPGTLLDSCMACAVHSTLAAGSGFTTVEYSVNLVRAITDETGPVRAEGRIVHRGRRLATADGRLTDAGGRLLAHGTTTCMILALSPERT